ncbi:MULTISPECIES: hypothetical protein [Burkholderia]|uniref:Uncharacterized protein n=1 Tax=Burkholderia contaminans TaxID=488447 RepID=A0A2S5E051_9BURK|nr:MULTISPECIES: hypothetical protein [Burkholderia]EKS9800290.1 hypothetical protein [Burkholderia cepacia]EKS9807891.1 hypothetical protein [Burkholderia cepacia]EKS9815491.1 hypothetical protein [Burkholderia cepacia]EKS9823004.1 hypothetical protein [Burkholderia cepacia]EKS9830594.1 hypothetical protein [Burkholderia cepacia]
MSDITDLRGTIVPKSDQLNAEQLLAGDMTITVTDVRMGSEDQPVILHYENDEGRPYKPCKTMRKLLIFAWGEDGRNWTGKSMTLYNDQAVRFGGMVVGGIRISHLSHIEREISLSLTATKGKKALHTVLPLEVVRLDDVLKAIATATDRNAMNAARALAMKLPPGDQAQAAQDAYNARMRELRGAAARKPADPQPGPGDDETTALAQLEACADVDALAVCLDSFRYYPGDVRERLIEAYNRRREALLDA